MMNASNLLICTHCGQKNRISSERPLREARCGKCHAAFFAGHPFEVADAALRSHIRTDDLPLLVDVWAPWCGPCRMMAPAFEAAAARLEPEVRLFKLNADNAPDISQRFAVRSIPTILLFHKGNLVARSSGAMTADQIVGWTAQHLPAARAA